jgi:hypothetical protein
MILGQPHGSRCTCSLCVPDKLTREYGPKCPEYEPRCACCAAWKLYERTYRFPQFDDVMWEIAKEVIAENSRRVDSIH